MGAKDRIKFLTCNFWLHFFPHVLFILEAEWDVRVAFGLIHFATSCTNTTGLEPLRSTVSRNYKSEHSNSCKKVFLCRSCTICKPLYQYFETPPEPTTFRLQIRTSIQRRKSDLPKQRYAALRYIVLNETHPYALQHHESNIFPYALRHYHSVHQFKKPEGVHFRELK